jgi:hypothetical protein
MQPLSAQDILDIWDYGQSRSAQEQALAMVAAGCPELSAGEAGALTVGERDARLLALRERTFGPRMDGFAECSRCRQELEFTLNTPDLRAAPPEPAGAEDYVLAVRGYEVRFRLLSSEDLAAAAGCGDVQSARTLLAQRCVVAAYRQGRAVSAARLPEMVVARLAARLAACDPRADLVVNLTCPACGHRWAALVDVAAYFWTELKAQARRLLREVHTLALAYGWSEADILAMSSRRRRSYLELVGA